ncbi:hypothetical protein KBX53_34740, partial [Micromonospora sp. M51]|uniref:hypothetical protein n=1 Tax=Micromonospora sp. M51 TaxID=2824889 RepID=UPI001B359365
LLADRPTNAPGRRGGAHRCPPALHSRSAQTPPRTPSVGRHDAAPLTLEPLRRPLTAGPGVRDGVHVRLWRGF